MSQATGALVSYWQDVLLILYKQDSMNTILHSLTVLVICWIQDTNACYLQGGGGGGNTAITHLNSFALDIIARNKNSEPVADK